MNWKTYNHARHRWFALAWLLLIAGGVLAVRIHGSDLADAESKTTGPSVQVVTDKEDAMYQCGQTAIFSISVKQSDKPVTAGRISALLSLDGGKEIMKNDFAVDGKPIDVRATLAQPGFLRCQATYSPESGKPGVAYAAAAFEPDKIQSPTIMPDDFDLFWTNGVKELDQIPIGLTIEPLLQLSDKQNQAYKISLAGLNNTRIHGLLSVPFARKPPYPSYVSIQAAGPNYAARPWNCQSLASRGALTLHLNIHDYDAIGLSKELNLKCYRNLNQQIPYMLVGAPDRAKYYFRNVLLGLNRAINYIAGRPDFNGKSIVVTGSSQGGGLALMLAGLNPRITAAAANVPAFCDHAGYLAERGVGWPGIATGERRKPEYLEMSAYFDAVNFARKINCPVVVSVGFIDGTCPPSSVYAAYNEIKASKRIINAPLSGHEQVKAFNSFCGGWLSGQLGLSAKTEPY